MSDPDNSEAPFDAAAARFAAMNLLARREHALQELHDKLRRRFPDTDKLEAVLQRLRDENLQSDQRFTESFARQRAARGYGPLRIRRELRDKGIDDAAISDAFEAAELDWYDIANDVFRKKFGAKPAIDIKEKARRHRFMQYRGFSSDHFQYLLND
tara:strand:- start:53025 stop:53492 length:468 start_codon:yes stop_codon:yes gene_type:complete